MLDWTPPPISTRRAGRLLWLGVITVVLVTAFAAPSTSAPRFRAGPDITGDQAGRSSQWIARPPLRQARGGLGVAKVGRQILAIGGFEGDNCSMSSKPAGSRAVGGGVTWRPCRRPGPTWPPPRWAGWCTQSEVSITANDLDVVETFNPRSGRWTTSLPLPQPRGAPGAAGLGGLLYVAGGEVQLTADTFEITNSVIVYDPKQNTWRSVAPMPTARQRLRLVASGRYLYAIGGRLTRWPVPDHGGTLRPQVQPLGHHEPDGRVPFLALRGRDQGRTPTRARRRWRIRAPETDSCSTHHRGL